MFKYESIVALFSAIVTARETFEIDFQADGYNQSGEFMVQEEAEFTIHNGDEFEVFFQVVHHPNGYATEAERKDRDVIAEKLRPSPHVTWTLPKFTMLVAAVRTSQGVIRLKKKHLEKLQFVRVSEAVQRIVEDEWVYLWQKEPRNPRD